MHEWRGAGGGGGRGEAGQGTLPPAPITAGGLFGIEKSRQGAPRKILGKFQEGLGKILGKSGAPPLIFPRNHSLGICSRILVKNQRQRAHMCVQGCAEVPCPLKKHRRRPD